MLHIQTNPKEFLTAISNDFTAETHISRAAALEDWHMNVLVYSTRRDICGIYFLSQEFGFKIPIVS
jgi:hypothetical protein